MRLAQGPGFAQQPPGNVMLQSQPGGLGALGPLPGPLRCGASLSSACGERTWGHGSGRTGKDLGGCKPGLGAELTVGPWASSSHWTPSSGWGCTEPHDVRKGMDLPTRSRLNKRHGVFCSESARGGRPGSGTAGPGVASLSVKRPPSPRSKSVRPQHGAAQLAHRCTQRAHGPAWWGSGAGGRHSGRASRSPASTPCCSHV